MAVYGIFSYGSLMIPSSAQAALQREISQDKLETAIVENFRRFWGVYVPITMDALDGQEVDGLFYDLRAVPQLSTIGALLKVSEAELDELKAREKQYDMVDISHTMRTDHDVDRVYTFIGKSQFRKPRAGNEIVVPLKYEQRILAAVNQRGDDFAVAFRQSGDAKPARGVDGNYQFVDPDQAKRV